MYVTLPGTAFHIPPMVEGLEAYPEDNGFCQPKGEGMFGAQSEQKYNVHCGTDESDRHGAPP